MLVKVFSLNKFKSYRSKHGRDDLYAKQPPSWTLESNGHKVEGGAILGTDCLSVPEWETYVDSKYVRR